MNKPISLLMKEFKNNLDNLLQNSELPVYIIEPMLKNTYNMVLNLSNEITLKQEAEYMISLEQEKSAEETTEDAE